LSSSDDSFNGDNLLEKKVLNHGDESIIKSFRYFSFYWILSAINLGIALIYIPICNIFWDDYLLWLVIGLGFVLLSIIIIIIVMVKNKGYDGQETISPATDGIPLGSDNLQQEIPDLRMISAKNFARYISFSIALVTSMLALCALPAAYFIIEIETEYFLSYLIIDILIMVFFIVMASYRIFTDHRKFKEYNA